MLRVVLEAGELREAKLSGLNMHDDMHIPSGSWGTEPLENGSTTGRSTYGRLAQLG